jgi:hypothetical protein
VIYDVDMNDVVASEGWVVQNLVATSVFSQRSESNEMRLSLAAEDWRSESQGKENGQMNPTYTGRSEVEKDGKGHFAEITVRARPSDLPTEVTISEEVLAALKSLFGPDFEYQRHNVQAAVTAQIRTANVKGMMPHVGAASFHAEVIGLRVSGNEGRELYGFLLSVAGMNAILEYLLAWEASQ